MALVKCKPLLLGIYQRGDDTQCDAIQIIDMPADKLSRKIAREYDERLMDPIRISQRNDTRQFVIDGRHRVQGTLEKFGEDATIEAIIYYDLTLKEEADLYSRYNTSRIKPTNNEIMKARYYAGDEEILAYVAALNTSLLPWTFGSKSGSQKPIFVAHRAGMTVFKEFGAETFVRALDVIAYTEDKVYTAARYLSAVALIINDCPIIIDENISKILTMKSDDDWKKLANGYGVLYCSSGEATIRSSKPLAQAILYLYNEKYQKRKKKLTLQSVEKEA